jgi:hypothetical protein
MRLRANKCEPVPTTNAPSVVRRPGSGRSEFRGHCRQCLLENDCSVSTVQATGALALSEEEAVDYLSCFGGSSYQTNGNNRHSAVHRLARVEDAMELQAPWVNGISDGLSVKEIETVHRVVTALRKKLGGGDEPDERG